MTPEREALVTGNLGLVYHMAKRLTHHPDQFEDNVQAGMEGLVKAARRFDSSVGVAFSTYATQRIRGSILDSMVTSNSRRAQRNNEHVPVVASLEDLTERYEHAFDVEDPDDEVNMRFSLLHAEYLLSVLAEASVQPERDMPILIRSVLLGHTNRAIATDLGMSATRVQQIIVRTCQRAAVRLQAREGQYGKAS